MKRDPREAGSKSTLWRCNRPEEVVVSPQDPVSVMKLDWTGDCSTIYACSTGGKKKDLKWKNIWEESREERRYSTEYLFLAQILTDLSNFETKIIFLESGIKKKKHPQQCSSLTFPEISAFSFKVCAPDLFFPITTKAYDCVTRLACLVVSVCLRKGQTGVLVIGAEWKVSSECSVKATVSPWTNCSFSIVKRFSDANSRHNLVAGLKI